MLGEGAPRRSLAASGVASQGGLRKELDGNDRPGDRSGLRAVESPARLASLREYFTGRSARHVVWFLAVFAAGGSLALTGSFRGLDGFDFQTLLEFAVGCSFVVSGLVAWSRRENRLGPLMTLIGFTWFARPLVNVDSSFVFTGAIWLQTRGLCSLRSSCSLFLTGD